MKDLLQNIQECKEFLLAKGCADVKAGIVLGSGLSAFINEMKVEEIIPYNEIPYFPVSTVEFHKGQLVLGTIGGVKVLAMQGRFHFYEGYNMQQITFPIRVMAQLDIKYLLLSNAAGGINTAFKKGDLVLIEDHINLLPENPLRGLNDAAFGDRFVDMSSPYNSNLNHLLLQSAKASEHELQRGVYAAVMGPNLETKAEYKYLKIIGADMVGMSTVPEVIVANQTGIACAAVSVITDECDPENLQPVNIAEILKVAAKADARLSKILADVVKQL